MLEELKADDYNMEESMCEATTPTVREEIDRIHSANVLYWRQREEPDREARAEHQRRQHRLDEIRADRHPCANDYRD
jgi:hypothetical protein